MMPADEPKELEGNDALFGYAFGCDGWLNLTEARRHLDVSRWTIDRLHRERVLRKGQTPKGRIVICRRSIDNYVAGCEVEPSVV